MTTWGGRFEHPTSETTWGFTVDTSDRRLIDVDIRGSIAHATMLGKVGVIPAEDSARIVEGLEQILEEVGRNEFVFVEGDEDVHSAVERRLGELVGEAAGKLHTGRSRNDQVATDLRLYLRSAGDERSRQIGALIRTIIDRADQHAETVVAGYTHLQQAQASTLGQHLLAYAWMLWRDLRRFSGALGRLNQSPLGAGALAGTSLPLDRGQVAAALGFDQPIANTVDAVASRDFVAEYIYCCASTMTHLSRLAEEVVLWSSSEFGWVSLPDEVSTGSSALPQKRNPDGAELVRGRTASVIGDLTSILILQKGLPLAYNRDLQEDKRAAFHADDTLTGALSAMTELISKLEFHPPPPGVETGALDLAETLVGRGVPFREAHRLVGELMRRLESEGRSLAEVTDADLSMTDPRFQSGDTAVVEPSSSVERRGIIASVRAQIDDLGRLIGPPD